MLLELQMGPNQTPTAKIILIFKEIWQEIQAGVCPPLLQLDDVEP